MVNFRVNHTPVVSTRLLGDSGERHTCQVSALQGRGIMET